MIQLILGVVACAIAFCVGYNVRVKEEDSSDTRYILVEKSSGLGGPCKNIQFLSLYFDGDKIFNEKDLSLEDENHFFLPLNENKLYVNRTVFRDMHLDGTVTYDHNGYNVLTKREIKRAFRNAQKHLPQTAV